MKRLPKRLIIALALLWLSVNWVTMPTSNLWAKTSHGISLDHLRNNVHEFILKNGLKVIILERHTSPTIAVRIFFRVGSVNERPGITGISHMIEHMLFKGTTTIGTKDYQREKPILERIDQVVNRLNELKNQSQDRASAARQEIKLLEEKLKSLRVTHQTYITQNELSQIYNRHGASGVNASTNKLYTQYQCCLPSNKLELWAWLESDRLSNPVWREFYQERDVVAEERRLRSVDNPRGALWEEFQALLYQAHPLGWPIIGWMSDIQSYTKEKLSRYFHLHYAPNNAVAVIVGDVNPIAVRKLMHRYFEPIPPATRLPEPVTTIEPPQRGERRVEIKFPAESRLTIGYHTVKIGEKDDAVLDVLSEILSGGRTSRFYKTLVLDKKTCLSIHTSNRTNQYTGFFGIAAIPQSPYTPSDVESAVYAEWERLKTEPVSEQELNKAKKSLAASFLRGMDSNRKLSYLIGYYEAIHSWEYIFEVIEQYDAVTAADIMTAVQKYFVPNNRTVAVLKPASPPTDKN